MSAANLLIGLWLVATPWVFGLSGSLHAVTNQAGVGATVAFLALMRVSVPRSAHLSVVNAALGCWLAAAAFAIRPLSASRAASINDLACGLAITALGVASAANACLAARQRAAARRSASSDRERHDR